MSPSSRYKDNAQHFHFHNRKNIERLEKADLTESDEDDDDDEDELEVIESGAKKSCLTVSLATNVTCLLTSI